MPKYSIRQTMFLLLGRKSTQSTSQLTDTEKKLTTCQPKIVMLQARPTHWCTRAIPNTNKVTKVTTQGRIPDTTPIYLNLYINLDESTQLLTELTGTTPTPMYRCSTQLLLITSNLTRTIIVNSSHLLDLVSFITRTLQGKIHTFDYRKNPEEKKIAKIQLFTTQENQPNQSQKTTI